MAADKTPAPVFSWQFLLVIAAGLGIFASHQTTLPFTSDDDASAAQAAAGAKAQTGPVTDARLWEDPYDALLGSDSGHAVLTAIPKDDRMVLGKPGVTPGVLSFLARGRICVMPVVVRGDSNSSEAHEMRIRFRMATVSGLGANGFVADDPNHLSWVQVALAGGNLETMPAEWYLRGGLARARYSPYDAVLVVWVRDSVLFMDPLKQLAQIRDGLGSQLASLGLVAGTAADFKVIGPYWSGTLVDILNEDPKDGIGITLYSSSATTADGILDLLAQPASKGSASGRKRLTDAATGPLLVNLTCDDEKLSESLINELALRGIDPGNKNSRIAIISDWDTDYGRVLPLTFAAKLQQWIADRPKGWRLTHRESHLKPLGREPYAEIRSDEASSWPSQILRAYYVSGVEGALRADTAQKAPDDSKTAPGSHSSAVSLQRAEGEHQVDYIARLGKILSERIKERNVKPGDNGKLVAIGVLGADMSDKLLLIQALRPLFKDAVFFTDSLDARFMDPIRAISFTRNLVVASPFGFDLFRNYQVGVPPFRSSEQTGAFLAVQAAAAMDLSSLDNIQDQLLPLRFEIGRTYPVALDVPGAARKPDDKSDLVGNVNKFDGILHPPQENFFPGWRRIGAIYFWPVLAAAIGAVCISLTIIFVALGRIPKPDWSSRNLTIVTSSALFLLIIGIFLCCYDGTEPATWIEGVSTWPSEFARLAALVVGVSGFFWFQTLVVKSRQKLAPQFGLFQPDKAIAEGAFRTDLERRPWNVIVRDSQPDSEFVMKFSEAAQKFELPDDGSRRKAPDTPVLAPIAPAVQPEAEKVPAEEVRYVIVRELWRDFCAQSTLYRRNVRTSVMTISFFAAWLLLGVVIGFPTRPYRGGFGNLCDILTIIGSSFVLTYLMFWVVDETHTCLRMVEKLGSPEPTLWPQEAYDGISTLRPAFVAHRVRDDAASAYLDVCFIGKVTQEAVPLIVLPFVVLTLMIVARWTFFDNWHWDPMILAIFGFDAAVCVGCAIMLRNAAVGAKARAIGQIGAAAAVARAANNVAWADALDALKKLMKENMDGAFKPWHQQPFVSAVLIPFGGSGGLGLIEFLLSR